MPINPAQAPRREGGLMTSLFETAKKLVSYYQGTSLTTRVYIALLNNVERYDYDIIGNASYVT